MRKKKSARIKQRIIDNLTLCRLQGDLYAVEASIRDNVPRAPKEEINTVKKFLNGLRAEIDNTIKRFNTIELSIDKEYAKKLAKQMKEV